MKKFLTTSLATGLIILTPLELNAQQKQIRVSGDFDGDRKTEVAIYENGVIRIDGKTKEEKDFPPIYIFEHGCDNLSAQVNKRKSILLWEYQGQKRVYEYSDGGWHGKPR